MYQFFEKKTGIEYEFVYLKKSKKRNHKTALRKILTLLPARTSKRRQ